MLVDIAPTVAGSWNRPRPQMAGRDLLEKRPGATAYAELLREGGLEGLHDGGRAPKNLSPPKARRRRACQAFSSRRSAESRPLSVSEREPLRRNCAVAAKPRRQRRWRAKTASTERRGEAPRWLHQLTTRGSAAYGSTP
jgi:hypothetical protein